MLLIAARAARRLICGYFNSASTESMLTPVPSKNLSDPLSGSDDTSTQHNNGRANTVNRKEHCDEKFQV